MTKPSKLSLISKTTLILLGIVFAAILTMYIYMVIVWTGESMRVTDMKKNGTVVEGVITSSGKSPYIEPTMLRGHGLNKHWVNATYSVNGKMYTTLNYEPEAVIGKSERLYYNTSDPSRATSESNVSHATLNSTVSIIFFLLISAALTAAGIGFTRVNKRSEKAIKPLLDISKFKKK